MKCSKQSEKVVLIKKLIEGLGFASPVDTSTYVEHETFLSNWICNVFDDPDFHKHKRMNELFDLNKSCEIRKNMTPKRILNWINRVIGQFSLHINCDAGGYQLQILNDVLEIIKRKNARGRCYNDKDNLLKQTRSDGDPFHDEETGRCEITVEFEEEETPPEKTTRKIQIGEETGRCEIDVEFEEEPVPEKTGVCKIQLEKTIRKIQIGETTITIRDPRGDPPDLRKSYVITEEVETGRHPCCNSCGRKHYQLHRLQLQDTIYTWRCDECFGRLMRSDGCS